MNRTTNLIRSISVLFLPVIIVVLVLGMLSAAESQPVLTPHVRDVVANGEARFLGPLPAAQTMRLEIVLGLRHRIELTDLLQELYNPSSPSYRKFLSVEEFTKRFCPEQEDYDALIEFVEANGLTVASISPNRMNVGIRGDVASIEAAFHVTMGLYKHPFEDRIFYAPDREPTVNLPFQIWRIAGIDNYSIPHPAVTRRKNVGSNPNATIGTCPQQSFCGSDMRAAYYGGTTLTGAGQSLGLLEYYGIDLDDVGTYYTNAKQTINVPITLVSTDETATTCYYSQGCDDTEQVLDTTQALGMAPNLASLVLYIGSIDAAILNSMATAHPLNAQLSSSWTWLPPDPVTADEPYFQEFAAQGQTYFNASGDAAQWSADSYPYVFPADDIYVTCVGGTDLTTLGAGGAWASETAWESSGGGIGLDGFRIPDWQVAAASGCRYCSSGLRNGPDVAAESNYDFYVCADQTSCTANHYGGTSFAAPMWAGYLALANEQAAANGQPPIGFINSALYSLGMSSSYNDDFHDIASGSNGYPATSGYDLVTGWGSPNGAALINALVSQQGASFGLTAKPDSLEIPQGASGTSTITVIPAGGFGGDVTLSASTSASGVTFAFNPNSTASTSRLTITANSSAAAGTYNVAVSGVSGSVARQTSLQLTVASGGGEPAVSLSPTSVTFADQVVGGTSRAKIISLKNTGSGSLKINSMIANGDFAIASKTCESALPAGAHCAVKITFTPARTGARNGAIRILDNAATSPQTVSLSGIGIAQATLTPAAADFPPERVGGVSPAKTFTLSNNQGVSLNGISIGARGDFSVSATTCTTTLAAKATCKISVVFKPTRTGTRTGTLRVKDSAGGKSQDSSLTGAGKLAARRRTEGLWNGNIAISD